MNTFTASLIASLSEIRLFFDAAIHNPLVIGFAAGLLAALLITGFILTKNPSHIPLILRLSPAQSFERMYVRDETGVYPVAYSKFLLYYLHLRIVSGIALTAFLVMITVVALRFG